MRRWLVGPLLAVALLGAACGGSSDDLPEASSSETRGEAEASPDPSARLRFAHYLGASSWDPHHSLGGPDVPLLALVYDTLVHVSKTGEAEPGLAESWEFGADGLSLTMKLRDGVIFSDGEAFDARVVKANIERALATPESKVKSLLSAIEGVTVVDPTTVTMVLKAPNSGLPLVLAERPGMMISPAALAAADITDPVGSGMFVLTSHTQGQSASFDRNPDYWDADVVEVAGLDMQIIGDSRTRLNALISGTIDMAQLDPAQISEAESQDLVVLTGEDMRVYAFELNPDLAPELGDDRVRLAISLAIDRQALVEGIFFGHGAPVEQQFAPSSPAYDPELEGAWGYDVKRAKELLAEAGLPDGFDLTVVIGVDPVQGSVAEAVQAQLKEVGIDLEIRKLEGFGSGQAYWTEKSVPAGLFRLTSAFAPTGTIEKFFVAGVQNNPGNVTSPAVDELLKKALAEPDPGAQIDLIHQISAELVEHPLSVIPIVQESVVIAVSPKVTGAEVWLAGFPNMIGVGVTK